MLTHLCIIVTILKLIIVNTKGQSHPIVYTTEGPILGQLDYSRNGRPYFEYLGIPYAGVPERYKSSVLPEPRNGSLFQALERGPPCIQYDLVTEQVKGKEDCLYLNIFTPQIPLTGKNDHLLPVMVFLHSGAFMFSSSEEYGGKYFADHNVVLVTLNFRLGSFGFLNTQDEHSEGNLGLKDQVTALRWINQNIEQFGGDPNLVTLFGDSSGAIAVHLHSLSPMSTGLFSRAISQSGTALCQFAFVRNPRAVAIRLGQMLNCPSPENTQELLNCLKEKSAEEIAAKHKEFIVKRRKNDEFVSRMILIFDYARNSELTQSAPSLEGNHGGEVFMGEAPYPLLKGNEIANKVPWMVGINSEECMYDAGLVLRSPELLDRINNDWDNVAPTTFYFKEDTLDPKPIGDAIREYYFQNKTIDESTRANLTNAYSDRYFGHCTRIGAFLHANVTDGPPVYLYHLTFLGNSSIANVLGINHTGVNMGDELQYLFSMDSFPEITGTAGSELSEFSDNLISLWTSFAATGRPEQTWGNTKEWPPINPEKGLKGLQYYQIDKETQLVKQPGEERMKFWDDLYDIRDPPKECVSVYTKCDFNYKCMKIERKIKCSE